MVRDRELTSFITCLLNVPVNGVALTTRLCSRLSCLSCDERSCSDGHGRRGRRESRDLGIGKSCKRRKLPKVSRWRPSLGDKWQLSEMKGPKHWRVNEVLCWRVSEVLCALDLIDLTWLDIRVRLVIRLLVPTRVHTRLELTELLHALWGLVEWL